jgi:hypothetical protein
MNHIPNFEEFVNESSINEGTFFRIPKNVISDDLFLASKNLANFYERTAAGNDVDAGVIDTIIRKLNNVKKSIKKFNNAEEIKGTVYECGINEGAMSDIDLLARDSKDFKEFVKNFKKDYKNMDAGNAKELEAWLKSVYDGAKSNR